MRSVVWAIGAFAILGAISAAGCASTDEAPAAEEEAAPARSGTSRTADDDGGASSRPAFDASFEDEQDANVDPTPGSGGDSCIDDNDPGSSENVAKAVPDTDDCDANVKTVRGVVDGPIDVDFYKFSMADKIGCQVETDVGMRTPGLELCVYARCKNATDNAVTGCKSGRLDTSDIGMTGCCAGTPAAAIPVWDCKGYTDNDSADFFVRVRQNGGNAACVPYSWTYRF